MVYDNPRCVAQAELLVKRFVEDKDPENLKKEIAGELNRFFCLGAYSVITPLGHLVKKSKENKP